MEAASVQTSNYAGGAGVCARVPSFAKNIVLDTTIHAPITWDRHEEIVHGGNTCQFTHLNETLLVLEELIDVSKYRFVVTQRVDVLPEDFSGDDVVVILFGDERCRIPRYASSVHSVFKWYGTDEVIDFRAAAVSPLAAASQAVYYLMHAFVRLNDRFTRMKEAVRKQPSRVGRIISIPLGYRNQIELPMRAIAERSVDVYFAGSVAHLTGFSPHRLLPPPKELARRSMLAAIARFSGRHPEARVDVQLQNGFFASVTSSADSYSRALMNSKICLTPPGTSLETFRFYEALRAGCIVVGQRLPPRPFYDGAPIVRVSDWTKLDGVLTSLLADPTRMESLSAQSVSWYNERCSPSAVAVTIAKNLG